MKRLIHLLFSLDSLLPIIFVYLIKEKVNLFPKGLKEFILVNLKKFPNILESYYTYRMFILAVFYILFMVMISSCLIALTKKVSLDEMIKRGGVDDLEIATDNFLPSYLGYFFVALSINDWTTFSVIFIFIYLFVQKSKQTHFNPIFIILGYKYYFISTEGIKSLIITKENLKNPKEVELTELKRINDYTFIN